MQNYCLTHHNFSLPTTYPRTSHTKTSSKNPTTSTSSPPRKKEPPHLLHKLQGLLTRSLSYIHTRIHTFEKKQRSARARTKPTRAAKTFLAYLLSRAHARAPFEFFNKFKVTIIPVLHVCMCVCTRRRSPRAISPFRRSPRARNPWEVASASTRYVYIYARRYALECGLV